VGGDRVMEFGLVPSQLHIAVCSHIGSDIRVNFPLLGFVEGNARV